MSNVTFDFHGNSYIVTGASSGMGRQVAVELVEAGADVLAIARREEPLRKLKSKYPKHIEIGVLDVCDKEKMKMRIEEYVEKNGKFSGAVHAAGISAVTPIKSYDEEVAHKLMETSFWGGMNLIQVSTKKRNSIDGASFVLFSSVTAETCLKGMFAYAGSKSAVNAAVKTVAKEIAGRKQRINSIMPGWVHSEMTESLSDISDVPTILDNLLLDSGRPQDVSGMVLFLLSDRAKWITGDVIPVDGGFLA